LQSSKLELSFSFYVYQYRTSRSLDFSHSFYSLVASFSIYQSVSDTARLKRSPHTEPTEIGAMLDQWCQECSKDDVTGATGTGAAAGVVSKVEWSFIGGQGNKGNDMQGHATTSTDASQNPWCAVFSDAMEHMGCKIKPQVFPAATDFRFLRALGIRALGFSPMRNTEIIFLEVHIWRALESMWA
jgi:hypothetical protein